VVVDAGALRTTSRSAEAGADDRGMTAIDTAPFVARLTSTVADLFGGWPKQHRELNQLTEYTADPSKLERGLPGIST
jgi:hypothetical protein